MTVTLDDGGPVRGAREWDALGTYVFLATDDPALLDPAQAIAEDVLRAVDRTCSRFRADSDLVRANTFPGRWVAVEPLLAAAVGVAVQAAEETDGLVDPCLGRALVWLGYDTDLRVVLDRPDRSPVAPPPVPRPEAWREIGVDPEGAVRVPPGCEIDLGATAKAWAGDLVAASVVEELGCRVVVSLGGDIRVDGPSDVPHVSWPVSVAERPGEEPAQVVLLGSGGLATSSTTTRRWTARGIARHHVLDPRTGRPTTGPWRTVTATGPTCVAANTATTAALVLGADAVEWLRNRGVAARLVGVDGTAAHVGGWPVPSSTPDARPDLVEGSG